MRHWVSSQLNIKKDPTAAGKLSGRPMSTMSTELKHCCSQLVLGGRPGRVSGEKEVIFDLPLNVTSRK